MKTFKCLGEKWVSDFLCFSYIKERKGNRLEVVDASDPNYMKALETAIRVGQPMLLKVWV